MSAEDRFSNAIGEAMKRLKPIDWGHRPEPAWCVLQPDECLIKSDDVRAGRWICSRSDHPSETSDCTTTGRIRHISETDQP